MTTPNQPDEAQLEQQLQDLLAELDDADVERLGGLAEEHIAQQGDGQ